MIEPLVPSWVDLRGFDDMPLDVKRLRDSKFSATVTPEEFRSGVLLWCAAWHQLPAASLPDDDVQLAQLAGYGYGVREWKRVRQGALYGWQLATDKRLYHETAAEKALQSWGKMVEHAYRRFADRWRKENAKRKERNEPALVICTLSHWKEVTCAAGIPAESAVDSTGIPVGNGHNRKELKGGVVSTSLGCAVTPAVDKSASNTVATSASTAKPAGNGTWHKSDAGIERKARELDLKAMPGETFQQLKARCFEESNKRERA